MVAELLGSRKDSELHAEMFCEGIVQMQSELMVCLVNERRKSLVCILKLGKWKHIPLLSLRRYKTNSRNSVTGCPFFTRIDNSFFINFVDVTGV